MTILVITTGGTIGALPYFDPLCPPRACTIPTDGRDIVRQHVESAYNTLYQTRCMTLELQDSSLITERYRQNIVDVLIAAPEENILITHGTDAILQTAEYLYQEALVNEKLAAKKIILTGAMVPLANGKNSDGYQNLHFALRQLSAANANLPNVSIVLSDFDRNNIWRPRLYRFEPGRYQKVYALDGRYNRLVDFGSHGDLNDLLEKVNGMR